MLIYSHTSYSSGAKALSRAIPARRIKHTGSRFRGANRKDVINWGAGTLPVEVNKCEVFNHPHCVRLASDKLSFFRILGGVSEYVNREFNPVCVVPHTESIAEAREWLAEGKTVVARTLLSSHSGKGIVLCPPGQEPVRAPLYTMYKKKSQEYRIHVGGYGGIIIAVQRKARRHDHPDPNWMIRVHDNGFIFAREGTDQTPAMVVDIAKQALTETGLNFGAVDVIFNEKEGRAYVLEVNTAPGLEGQTVQDYATYFRRQVGIH